MLYKNLIQRFHFSFLLRKIYFAFFFNSQLHTLDLLQYFGYQDNGGGNYVYQSTSSNAEMTARDNATKEFHRFYNDLKKIKDDSLDGFKEFITVKF